MEPEVPSVIYIKGNRYFVHDLTIDVRRVRFGYKSLKELNLLDLDKADKVLNVRRLPTYTIEEEQLCYCIRCTKPCRRNLLLPGTEPISQSWTCTKRGCPHYYHIQDTVQFLEEITYLPKQYVEHPQPKLFPYVHQLRDTRSPTRRQIIYDFENYNVSVYHPDVDGKELHEGWHDQHYRDFRKYKDRDTAGIIRCRLPIATTVNRYFDHLQNLSDRNEATRLQVHTVIYKLLLTYGGDTTQLLRGTEHLKKEYQVTVLDRTTIEQEYWQVRTIDTLIPTTIISDRYPYHYHRNFHQFEFDPTGTIPTITYRYHTIPYNPIEYRTTVQGLLCGKINQLISN